MIETKAFPFEIESKGVAEDGTFEGWAATYSLDLGGDRIVPKAFADSIRKTKGIVPVLWQHDRSAVIGLGVKAEERDKGLWVAGRLMLKNALAQTARDWMKLNLDAGTAGAGLSIGYRVLDAAPAPGEYGVRLLKRLELCEWSVVTFPMNLEARVTAAKGISDEDWVALRVAITKLERLRRLHHGQGLTEEANALYAAISATLYRLDQNFPQPVGRGAVPQPVALGGKDDDDEIDDHELKYLAAAIRDCEARIQ